MTPDRLVADPPPIDIDPATSVCCTGCFLDDTVIAFIEAHGAIGPACSFCGSNALPTVRPSALTHLFAAVFKLYTRADLKPAPPIKSRLYFGIRPAPERQPLHIALQRDWEVFNDDGTESLIIPGRLLDAILNANKGLADKRWDVHAGWLNRTDPHFESPVDDVWSAFCHYVKFHCRYLLGWEGVGEAAPLMRLLDKRRLNKIVVELAPKDVLFRARRGNWAPDLLEPGDRSWEREMQAAPAKKTNSNRLNAAGIRATYAADQPETAVAEIRAAVGDEVTVVEVQAIRLMRIIDLSQPLQAMIDSPFGHTDVREQLAFAHTVRVIGTQMGRPVREEDAHVDYVPTQYVAEWIRQQKFDGIKYRSATQSGGCNYVIFDTQHTVVKNPIVYTVEGVSYKLKRPWWRSQQRGTHPTQA